ncbi:MAG: MBL fold metallo-hydrolase [Acidobacteriota bacterium]|nr:MBL fold metallo-hydrolase [Acidobacteriota bacterium]MDH3523052.1 MBL fold metallo-hydrolase [Acidobacteriota bacterium]
MQLHLGLAPAPLRLCVLGSGSSGNSVVVESGSHRVLVDAGFACRQIEKRLLAVGVDPGSISAIVLTHEHGDHVRGAARFAKRHGAVIYGTRGTLEHSRLAARPVPTRELESSRPQRIDGFLLHPFKVPHDAREPIGLVIEDGSGRRIGVACDLGAASRLAWAHLADLDGLVVETNHDLDMLRNGPYPWHLKQRVASRHGHLSNREAAEGLAELISDRLQWVVLYHLSRTNNSPVLAAEAIGRVLRESGSRARVCVSEQLVPTPWLAVEDGAPVRETAPSAAVHRSA